MAYLSGYKRPRQDDNDLAAYSEYGQYATSSDFGVGPPSLLPSLQPLPPLQPLQSQAPVADPIRLGSAPDGSMPVVKLRGLPFSCDIESITLFLVRLRCAIDFNLPNASYLMDLRSSRDLSMTE